MNKYYDGTKLLSMKDLDGNKPELYLCTTNRTAGKTTYFGRLCVNSFIKKEEKFALLYRYNYELDDVANKFFKDIGSLFFPEYYMNSVRRASGIFHELFLTKDIKEKEGISCGYAISLNSADQIKKYSHLFSDVKRILFDEFQSETNHYCPNEISKFISVHTSIARGQGEQVRYVPVYLCGNAVTLLNPYYTELGISDRLNKDTKFLRGHGYVLENGFVESASMAQKESPFFKAFNQNKYVEYSSQNIYLDDNESFIEKPKGIGKYLATFIYEGKNYAIREYLEDGIVYCDDSADSTFKFKIAVSTADHRVNYVMLNRNDIFIMNMKYYFEKGCFRFKNLKCKEALMKLISLNIN